MCLLRKTHIGRKCSFFRPRNLFYLHTLAEIIAFETLVRNISYIKLSNQYLLITIVLYYFRKQNLKRSPNIIPVMCSFIHKQCYLSCYVSPLLNMNSLEYDKGVTESFILSLVIHWRILGIYQYQHIVLHDGEI